MVCTIAAGTSFEYYLAEQQGYYIDGKEPLGKWFSVSGAFGVEDESHVTPQRFQQLHEGKDAFGNSLSGTILGIRERVGAYDITFSPPKSVSVIWALSPPGQRVKVEQAQEKAVRDALKLLSQNASFARRGRLGKSLEQVSLTAALFQHGEARPTGNDSTDMKSDPQLHTHAVVFNLAERADGTIGGIDGRHLFRWKMAVGAFYHAALAANIQRSLGLGITETDKNGLFEVEGVPREVIARFSSRRKAIESSLGELGIHTKDNAKLASTVAKSSRAAKEAAFEARDDQFTRWKAEASELGFSVERLLVSEELLNEQKPMKNEKLEIFDILGKLTETESVFQLKDLYRAVASAAVGNRISGVQIDQAVRDLVESDAIVQLSNDKLGQAQFSTRTQIEAELKVVELANDLARPSRHMLPESEVLRPGTAFDLSEEQQDAVEYLTMASDIVILEGAAGSGKSYSLRAVSELYAQQGYCVLGTSTAWKAANRLGNECKIESTATDALLADISCGKRQFNSRTVLIVDEAGLLSVQQMRRVLKLGKQSGAKIILTGDQKQLQSIGAGPGLRLVAEQIGAVRIDKIRRQKQKWAREAVSDFAYGHSDKGIAAFRKQGMFHIEPDADTVAVSMVEKWAADKMGDTAKARLLIARTNNEVDLLNNLVRAKLQDSAELGHDQICVANAAGKQMPIAIGERVTFTQKIPALGVFNGTEAHVIGIDLEGERMTVEVEGRRLTANLEDIANRSGKIPLRYSYASTLYSAQGATVDEAYIWASSRYRRNDIYVAASRAKDKTFIFIDQEALSREILDKTLLAERSGSKIVEEDLVSYLAKNWSLLQEKESAIELIPENIPELSVDQQGSRVRGIRKAEASVEIELG